MILLWGMSGDDPFEAVAQQLCATSVPFVQLDQRHVLASHVELAPDARDGIVRGPGFQVALRDIHALYIRNYDAHQLGAVRDAGAEGDRQVDQVESALWCFADVAPIRVLNRPSAMQSNNSKPFQARLIRAQGFEVPETLITTDPDAARAFWQRHRSVIYKSISGQRSIVQRLGPDHLERFDDLQWCPTQLQQQIQGRDVRVHIIGEQVFATAVTSTADDYRYAIRHGHDVAYAACELPDAIAARCIALATALELPLAGIDLRESVDGRWYCFEVNPSPCFTFYEGLTAQPMVREVARYLGHQ